MISITKNSEPKSSIINASWNIGWTVWSTIINFVMTPILINHIGDSHYGTYVLLTSISGILGIFNLGLGEATLRYVAFYYSKDDLNGINRVVGSTFLVYCVSGLLGFVVLFIGAPQLVQYLAIDSNDIQLIIKLLQITAFSFCLNLINGVLDAIPKAMQRYDINTKVVIFQSFLMFIGNLIILFSNRGIFELVLWSSASVLIIIFINYVVAKRLIPGLKLYPTFSKDGIKEVFGYGFFSMLTSILSLIWGQADRLLLGSLVSSSSVAYLSVPQSMAMRGSSAIGNAGSVLFPKFAVITDNQERKKIYLDATWLLLTATVTIFVPFTVLFPKFLILWVGPEFAAKSAFIGQLIAFSCIPRGAFVPYDSLFKGIGKPKYLTLLYLLTGITSLATNLLLIPKFGLAGAGYSYLITLVWGFITVILTWIKIFDESTIKPLLRAVCAPIIEGLLLLPILSFVNNAIGDIGWIKIFGTMLLFMLVVFLVLVGLDYLFGKKNWHFRPVFNYIHTIVSTLIRRFSPKGQQIE